MTLMERINQLRLRALAADDEDRVRRRTGEFAVLTERVQGMAVNASSIDDARLELAKAGYFQDAYKQDRRLALDTIRELNAALTALPVDGSFDAVKTRVSHVEQFFRNSETYIASTWKTQIPPEIQDDDDLLAALESGGVDVEAIRSDVESAKASIFSLRHRILPQRGDTLRLQHALDTLNSTSTRIGEVINPSVASLVVRAQGNGVSYSEFTPEIVSSLKDIGILERFRVVLK